jgi:hypothetical protein
MKITLTAFRRKTLFLMLLFAVLGTVMNQNQTAAQVPDCSGTVMYGLWNDSIGSTTNTPSQIRAIDYVTGAVGPQMGGPYLIQTSTGGTTYYGSAGLGLDPVYGHFFVMTQMGTGTGKQKDIYDINTSSGAMTRIFTTPTSTNADIPVLLSNYHFVKLAVSPGGIGYAIGVHRDTSIGSYTHATCNPVISFTTCGGAPTANCSTVRLLGFLSNATDLSTSWRLFNGDIAFDNIGNLYFLTVAYSRIAGNGRYTDARLFRISAANIPTTSGTGAIPLTLMAEYNGLDSTVVNGIAFNMMGEMFFSTRTFNGPQNSPPPTYNNVIMRSIAPGTVTPLAGFTNPVAGFSMADLASCNFPTGVLSDVKLHLNGWNESGTAKLRWNVNMNNQVSYYEIESSSDGNNFEHVARVNPLNTNEANATYQFTDVKHGDRVKYYRVREIMPGGTKYYSNIIKINFGSKLQLVGKPNPNPFNNKFDLRLELKSAISVMIKLRNQNGSLVYQRNLVGGPGENRFTVDGLSNLGKGIYIVEISADDEIIREKLIKQ